jgi:CheY-like chemotaxis protein
MCRYQIGRGGALETALGSPPAVMGSSQQLGQILLNLLMNASQATTERRANVITVRTLPTADGGAEIQVEDTGAGMSDTSRIWEPFYTTKPKGVGTGLGLSIVKRIVLEHGGQIDVRSDPARGTLFRITLPGATTRATVEPPRRRTACVLILDDEDLQLRSLTRALKPTFEVLTATSVRDAMEIIRRGALPDAVVSDIQMPDADGIEFYRWILEEAAPLADRFLFLTGAVRRIADVPEPARDRILTKPCPDHDLVEAIQRVVPSVREPSC